MAALNPMHVKQTQAGNRSVVSINVWPLTHRSMEKLVIAPDHYFVLYYRLYKCSFVPRRKATRIGEPALTPFSHHLQQHTQMNAPSMEHFISCPKAHCQQSHSFTIKGSLRWKHRVHLDSQRILTPVLRCRRGEGSS